MITGIGDRYHKETKYSPETLGGHTLDRNSQPEQFKSHDCPISVTPLPEPELRSKVSLWEILQKRRSYRTYDESGTISGGELSALLWATQGVTAKYGEMLFRTAPSAGALFPVETYISVRAVEGLENGIYHFRPQFFDLEFLKKGDHSKELAIAALGQGMITRAQVSFIWTAVVERSKWKYRQRAYRYIYMDSGHIAENLYLAGEALDLGVCTIGAFFDDMADSLLGIEGDDESVIYMATVGCRKNQRSNR